MRKLIFLLFSNLIIGICFSQKIPITGTITDSSGNGISDASIKERGTRNGTISDKNGSFKLNTAPGSQLEISVVGYNPVMVKAAPNLSVRLNTSNTSLTEVVVTALGIKREKRQLTYSTQEVSGESVVQAKQDHSKGFRGMVIGTRGQHSARVVE